MNNFSFANYFNNNDLVLELQDTIIELAVFKNFKPLKELRESLKNLLQSTNFSSFSPSGKTALLDTITLADLYSLTYLNKEELIELFQQRLIRLFRLAARESLSVRNTVFSNFFNHADDAYRFRLRKAVLEAIDNNEEILGGKSIVLVKTSQTVKPTIANYLRDFRIFSRDNFFAINQLNYFSSSENARRLIDEDRKVLQDIFALYSSLLTEALHEGETIDLKGDKVYTAYYTSLKKLKPSFEGKTPLKTPVETLQEKILPEKIPPPSPPVFPRTPPPPIPFTMTFTSPPPSAPTKPETTSSTAISWQRLQKAMEMKEEPKELPMMPRVAPATRVQPAPPVKPVPPPTPAPSIVRRQPTRPLITDIKAPPKPEGPLEELRELDLNEFRRLGSAREAMEKIKAKIDLLAEESFAKKAEGIKAWQSSALNKLYLQIGHEAMDSGRPVGEMLGGRLTMEEFEAIADLNRELRF